MKKILLPLIVIAMSVLSASAQNGYEYGGVSNLKGLKTVYLSPEIDMKDRERIAKAIGKENLSDLKIVDDGNRADIVLVFGGETDSVITGATFSQYSANIVRVPLDSGTGMVFVQDKEKPKLVLKVSNTQQSRLEKRPVTKFVQAFIKAYKEANGLTTK